MSMNFIRTKPPVLTDADILQVVVKETAPSGNITTNKMTVREAHARGLCEYEEDETGYLLSFTSLEGEPGFPENIVSVRPVNPLYGEKWQHQK